MLYRNHHDKHNKNDIDERFLDAEEDDRIMDEIEEDDGMMIDYPPMTFCQCSECRSVFY